MLLKKWNCILPFEHDVVSLYRIKTVKPYYIVFVLFLLECPKILKSLEFWTRKSKAAHSAGINSFLEPDKIQLKYVNEKWLTLVHYTAILKCFNYTPLKSYHQRYLIWISNSSWLLTSFVCLWVTEDKLFNCFCLLIIWR